jgi:N-acetyl-anhydromuramyl-L-alanine amidase AmpD
MTFPLLVVIHETLITAEDSIRLHGDPNYYGSYHALIHKSGTITYLTPADCKAYAAGNSIFINGKGEEEHINNSVNDFAYHIALETPPDGIANKELDYHIGYTKEQYSSLAWLCKAVDVDPNRITFHSYISLETNKKEEPRCFNNYYFGSQLENAHNKKSIDLGILDYLNGSIR